MCANSYEIHSEQNQMETKQGRHVAAHGTRRWARLWRQNALKQSGGAARREGRRGAPRNVRSRCRHQRIGQWRPMGSHLHARHGRCAQRQAQHAIQQVAGGRGAAVVTAGDQFDLTGGGAHQGDGLGLDNGCRHRQPDRQHKPRQYPARKGAGLAKGVQSRHGAIIVYGPPSASRPEPLAIDADQRPMQGVCR